MIAKNKSNIMHEVFGRVKLNIGIGNRKLEGYVNVDIDADKNPDLICNIEEGLPYPHNSISEIKCIHFIEHIHQDKFIYVMNELHRVLKPKGRLIIVCPYFACGYFSISPLHYIFINQGTFDFLILEKKFKLIKKKILFFRESREYESFPAILDLNY